MNVWKHGVRSSFICYQLLFSVRSSRYEARGKFGEHERCVRVARGLAESNSSFLKFTSYVIMYADNISLRSGTCQREGYRDKQQHWGEFTFLFSSKFAIQRPISNTYFASRIQEKIMSDFWYRVRGRCSISIALTKSTRFLLVFVNSATVGEKCGIICLKVS